MRSILLASAALPLAFMSDVTETVLIKGSNGPVRVNKSDYDADQDAENGGKGAMTLHRNEAEQSAPAGALTTYPENVPHPVAAPSAPDFTGGGEIAQPPIDPTKDAVAPAAPSPNSRLVAKEGRKFFVVDGTGARIEEAGIDKDGYKDEKTAWDAIMALPR